MRHALAIFLKDVRIEWRTRESVASVFVLGVLLLVAPDAIPAFTIPGTGSMSPADPMMP